VEIHRSARRHGIADADTRHAVDHPLVEVDLDLDSERPRLLVIGPDRSGNLLEVIVLLLADERRMAIHAMKLRAVYLPLLGRRESNDD
jgi:hypothetical protein